MIAYKSNKLPKKSALTFLGLSFLSSLVSLQVSAQNMGDDLALVDGMLNAKVQGLNLDKELDIHMRILKERYPANVLKIQEGKVQYSKDQKAKARGIFSQIGKEDPNFREMVFTYFKYALKKADKTGQTQAATFYFETKLKSKIPKHATERRELLMDMIDIYGRAARKDQSDPKKLKFKALEAWAKKNNIEIPQIPPTQEMEDANNIAEKIVMRDKGYDKEAKVDVGQLEKLIKAQLDAEWGELNYWFFKGVIERARSQVLLGKYDEGLKTLKKFYVKIQAMDEEIFKIIDADKAAHNNNKTKIKALRAASSLMSGVRYVKGLANFLKARKAKKKGDMAAAKELLKGRTGAAAQFGLCLYKNKGSKEAYKAILRYDKCRDLDKVWFPQETKRLRGLDKSPFNVEDIDLGKAYYGLQMFDKAVAFFDKYKVKPVSDNSYDAVYYGLWAHFEAGREDKIEEYLGLLESKFFDRNKKPKDWFTQSCLRLSGKYRTKKNEETDPAKKKIYESKQLSFFKRSQRLGGNAPTAYTLAYGELRECFGFKRNKKFAKAKEMYATAIQSFSLIVKRFPGSTEEVKAYKQLGLLHEYFKDLEKSKTMYEECMKRIATPDVAGKVEKIDVMTSLANVHFLSNDYDGTIAALIEIDKYADSEKFKTTDDALIKKIKALEEKRITLNIFSLDNQLIPKKKELRVLKSDLKLNPEDEVLKGKVEATAKEITDGLTKTLTSFKKWLTKFQSSPNCPSVMARLGSLHQELGQSADAKRVYERLKAKYPDHEVVKLISINIVRAHLKNEDQAAAAEALEDTNLQELDDSSLQYLIREFVVEEIPRGMSSTTVKDCSAVAVKVIDILRPRYEKAKKDLNRLHWLDYRKARSLYNLNKLDPAKVILERMAKEKPYGPYIFEAKFLLGAISSKQGDYNTVSGIYASLKALSTRMPEDLNREVRISVEWANAYHDVQGDPRLTKKGRGLAMMTKDMNIEKLDEVGLFQVQKAWYLFIHYSKKMELEISELKKEFLKTYPGSPYAFKVRKL